MYENQTKYSIDLSWSFPADDGGSPITGYAVESTEKLNDDKELWKVVAEVSGRDFLSCTVSDLVEGKMYSYRVKAVNKAGKGKPSEATPYIEANEQSSM